MKNEPKKERLWERKTCQNHVRDIKIKVFRFLKKVEKMNQKGLPEVIQNRLKRTMGPSRFDLFIDIIDFGHCRTKHVFSIDPKTTQNNKKSAKMGPWAEKGPNGRARVVDCGDGRDPREGVAGG